MADFGHKWGKGFGKRAAHPHPIFLGVPPPPPPRTPEMLKLCRVTKVKVFFLVLVYVFNFDLFEFSAAILEKGLFFGIQNIPSLL